MTFADTLAKKPRKAGTILVGTLVYATISAILLTGLIAWAGANYKLSHRTADREQAFQIAEAGIDYYRWHLAHAQQDYWDGNASTTPGPYVHPYFDKLGNRIGQFELSITPPPVGSTVVKIVSKGIVASSSISRSIEEVLAIPSLSRFAFVANAVMRYGEGTVVYGPVHGNDGIRFDGVSHNIVTSAVSSYSDPDHNGPDEFGVHTHVQAPPGHGTAEGGLNEEESSNGTLPSRPDIFMSGRDFPVPAVDWSGFTQDLATLKTLAQSGGRYLAGSGAQGYNIVLKTNGTFDLFKVTALVSAPHSCNKPNWDDQAGWGTWSIQSSVFVRNYPFPANGVIFVEDNVWVEGQINNARLTIASGRFPESPTTNTSINFNKNILYTNYDGRDVLALIAQYNVNAGMVSNDTLEVDGALVAKNGRVGRYYYNASCHPYDDRTQITIYGMLASKERYGFAYTGSQSGGYAARIVSYDGNLLYNPPPSFPLVSNFYEVISWREI